MTGAIGKMHVSGRSEPEDEREHLEHRLKRAGVSELVRKAMMCVPRDRFVPDGMKRYAWIDESLPIGRGQTISQPSLVGRMIDQLRPHKRQRVLDVGTGSGYQAAILAQLVAQVISVERVPELKESAKALLDDLGYGNVEVFDAGDELGWPPLAPYDGIIVGAASPEIPDGLVSQLSVGGRLVIPVGTRWEQRVAVVLKTPDGTEESWQEPVRFVPLIGKGAWLD